VDTGSRRRRNHVDSGAPRSLVSHVLRARLPGVLDVVSFFVPEEDSALPYTGICPKRPDPPGGGRCENSGFRPGSRRDLAARASGHFGGHPTSRCIGLYSEVIGDPMKNYLVITYLPDTGQIVFDTVLAEHQDGAEDEVRRVRGEDISVGEVHETVEFARTVADWAAETHVETWESWNLTVECYGAEKPPRPEMT
jgi:hypothetical protein